MGTVRYLFERINVKRVFLQKMTCEKLRLWLFCNSLVLFSMQHCVECVSKSRCGNNGLYDLVLPEKRENAETSNQEKKGDKQKNVHRMESFGEIGVVT